jgi:threonine dehydrogenase-like Zn-dependent dehydrogenase
MQGLLLAGPAEVEHRRDLPDATIEAPTDVIVRVRLAGLCGSDLHPYLGRERVRPGVVPGHEAVGEAPADEAGIAREQDIPLQHGAAPYYTF